MRKFTLLIASLLFTIGAMAQVTVNTSAYTVKSVNRGFLYYDANNAGSVTSSSHTDLTDATPTGLANEQFAFLRTDNTAADQYYMYSIGASQFVTYTGSNGVKLELTDEPACTWVLEASGTYYGIKVPGTDQTYINITNYEAVNGCKVIGTGLDEGNKMTLTEVATGLDLSAAIAKIEVYESNLPSKISDFYEAITNFSTYEGTISNIINGNTGDKWWSAEAQAVDKNIIVKLNNVHQVGVIKWYFCDGDKPHGATIERKATADGEWINVADFTLNDIENNVFTCTANGNDVKELRLRITTEHSNWLQVAEVELYELINVDKTELQELIVEAENLFDQISSSEKKKGDNELELSGKISSNAAQNNADGNTGGQNDGAGIAGLTDTDASTYFHSRWGGQAIDEDHYLQIDLGDGNNLSDFVFEYAVRKTENANNTSPAPTSIEVRVSEDGADFGEPIVTLTATDNNLPAYNDLGNTLWCSDVIEAGINARYIRFTVTGSAGPGNNNWEGHYFFAMGTLNLYPTKDGKVIADNYKECITEELFNAYVEAINEAKSVNESVEAMPSDVETAREELAAQLAAIKAVLTHPLTVTAAGYATLYLGFDAAIPEGAEAYIVKQSDINEGYITMTQIEGTIPANTGVIVKANPETYRFAYSAETKADVTGNLLAGSVADEYVEGAAYVLGNKNGVGLYKAEMNQLDGTAWLNNANKAYLPASALTTAQQTVAFYGFDWNGTTGIEQITDNREQSTAIFDLTGRRVESISAPGIYIVNGKKVLVK